MNFGVVGWGLRRHLPILAHQPDKGWNLTALADPSPVAQERFREAVGGDPFITADFMDLVGQGLDAVFVLSPDWLHESQAVALLEAGVAVYLEKPMAITVEGCDRILEAAQQSGAKLYLGHNMRHFPVVQTMRDWIQKGAIGEVQTAWCRHFVSYGGEAYYRDWHADRTLSGGLLLQKGAHDIDVLHWLCGGYGQRVTAMGKLAIYDKNPVRMAAGESQDIRFERTWPPASLEGLHATIDVEDLSMMVMELDNGVIASYQQCHFTPDAWRNYCIIGSEGRIENFGDGPGSVVRIWNRNHHGYAERGDIEIRIPESSGPHAGADAKIIDEFVRYIQEGGETATSPIAARMAVAVGVAATESLRTGSIPVAVEPLGAPSADRIDHR